MRSFHATDTPLLSVEDAVARVLAEVRALPAETVPLGEAAGRVLREDVIAAADVPPADNSAMDGYAVRAADTPGRLTVIDDLPAGRVPTKRVTEGTAIRIMTGAPIPDGADAVAQVEITDRGTALVEIGQKLVSGTNLRRRGEDMRSGDLILAAGGRVGAGEIGVAATARRESLVVGKRPVVAILATGDELGDDGIVDSNSYALEALVREAGGIARRFPTVRDTRDATVRAIESALACDFIVTTGGVSVGAYDFVQESIESLGATTHFWRVAMKPGKPVLFATLRDRPFFGLPGNPVSAMVSFTLFVAPAIRKAQGQTTRLTAPVVTMRTASRLKGAGDRRAYLRVRVIARDGVLSAEPMRAQGSHIATSMIGANGLAIVDGESVEAGEAVSVMLIGPVSPSS